MLSHALKRFLIGRPIATSEEHHQRLRKKRSPCRSSPPTRSRRRRTRPTRSCSCSLAQAGIGVAAFTKLVPIAIVVAVLLVDRGPVSYRQTIYAYPSGGGSYIVSRRTSATLPSLVAGASLLVDYILTVAVSVAGGVLGHPARRSASAASGASPCACVIVADDGRQPARPEGVGRRCSRRRRTSTSSSLVLLIVVGCTASSCRTSGRSRHSLSPEAAELAEGTKALGAADAAAGVLVRRRRAVRRRGRSNGVPAVPKPESRNAATTLAIDGRHPRHVLLRRLGAGRRTSNRSAARTIPTGIALMAEHIYGGKGMLFWITQFATFAILILAANTAYAGLPRAVVDHRQRRLHAPPVRQPRRPARVLQRRSCSWPSSPASWSSSSRATSRPSSRCTRSVCSPGSR